MVEGPATNESEMLEAIRIGIEEAQRAAKEGIAILGLGEMGIGNTASAATLAGCEPARVTGRGTGSTLPRCRGRSLPTNVMSAAVAAFKEMATFESAGIFGTG